MFVGSGPERKYGDGMRRVHTKGISRGRDFLSRPRLLLKMSMRQDMTRHDAGQSAVGLCVQRDGKGNEEVSVDDGGVLTFIVVSGLTPILCSSLLVSPHLFESIQVKSA